MSYLSGAGDHAMGVELELEELVEQRARATAQHRDRDARRLDAAISELQSQLAEIVEGLAGASSAPLQRPVIRGARITPRQTEAL